MKNENEKSLLSHVSLQFKTAYTQQLLGQHDLAGKSYSELIELLRDNQDIKEHREALRIILNNRAVNSFLWNDPEERKNNIINAIKDLEEAISLDENIGNIPAGIGEPPYILNLEIFKQELDKLK